MCNRCRPARRTALKTVFGNITIIDEGQEKSIDGLDESPELVSGYARPKMPVMIAYIPQRFEMMAWGYIPRQFGGNPEIMAKIGVLLNARAEDILTKASFKNSIRERRCIIPFEGFYDYQHRGSGKTKYTQTYYVEKNAGLLFAAGVWDEYQGLKTFAVITTDANPLMVEIHNKNPRQPHIIDMEHWERWLNPDLDDEGIMDMLKVYPDDNLKASEYNPPKPPETPAEPGTLF